MKTLLRAQFSRSLRLQKDIYRLFLVKYVIPAIKAKWVWPDGIERGDIVFSKTMHDPTFKTTIQLSLKLVKEMVGRFTCVLDLGFFNSIQALQQQMVCSSFESLIHAVKSAFADLPATTLEGTFGTLQRVVAAVVDAAGDKRYKVPRSLNYQADILALDMMNLRLEEEGRLEELTQMMDALVVDFE
ncbi:hypothetical protein H310_08068 [Aphanomyces invadans]|uniref:Uncharacterized protein n=1 Tax=Aphanomyces invadans TaxID=157072 RepID=A0A024TZF6_9STRA|nr:hypothetical protein H310_08068 [Aphanomyces invadans]ETV99354.1 hypothetical protein H310_08068 [Aphanomyces invadans]|eukprot:XP_008871910.1 hypothetical protein H310_08068 [Aphanomyces invadans]